MDSRSLSDGLAAKLSISVDGIRARHDDVAGALSADRVDGIDPAVQATDVASVFCVQRARAFQGHASSVLWPDISLRVETAPGGSSTPIATAVAQRPVQSFHTRQIDDCQREPGESVPNELKQHHHPSVGWRVD